MFRLEKQFREGYIAVLTALSSLKPYVQHRNLLFHKLLPSLGRGEESPKRKSRKYHPHNSSTRLAKERPHFLGGWAGVGGGGGGGGCRPPRLQDEKKNEVFVCPSHTNKDKTVVNLNAVGNSLSLL